MRLTVVGCSGSISGPESPASCYLVQAPYQGRTFSLLLDCGPGAMGALYSYVDPKQIDAVALSHLHPDHCIDMCGFFVAARYSATAPWPRAAVYGPVGTAERLARAYEVEPRPGQTGEPGPSLVETFAFTDWAPEQQIGPFTVHVVPVEHPVEAYGIRIEERSAGRAILVYSGDTGPCEALVELSRGADLLLAEASFMEGGANPPGLHLTGREAGEIARTARVGELVLTHIPPWHDRDQVLAEGTPAFDGPVSLAMPGASWEIGGV